MYQVAYLERLLSSTCLQNKVEEISKIWQHHTLGQPSRTCVFVFLQDFHVWPVSVVAGLPWSDSFMQGTFRIALSYPSHLELIVGFVSNLLINTSLAEFSLRSAFAHNSTSTGLQVRGLGVCPQRHPTYL